jgi:hypothetical protein
MVNLKVQNPIIKFALMHSCISGLAWRWGIAYSDEIGAVVLQLQALPYSGNHIKANPAFLQDELAVVVLATFDIDMNAFNGAAAAGPVPVFVSSAPEDALASLQRPEHAHRICQALAARITTTEVITGEQAVEMGPQPRLGKTRSPLVRAWLPQEPANKRAREDAEAAIEQPAHPGITGTVKL